MATLASSSPYIILHRFVLRRPTVQFASLITQPKQCLLKTTPFLSPSPFSTRSLLSTSSPAISEQLDLLENALTKLETETPPVSAAPAEGLKRLSLGGIKTPPPPSLTVKEKKDLASYAHSLGKKLKSQQVGKSGVTDLVITALIETLEANELLKIKIHSNCPDELEDAVRRLEEGTGSVVVGQIGRTVILYRPSVTKLKAEEKKKQAQIAYLKKQSTFKQFSQNKRPVPVPGEETRYGRGRRGSSRY